MREPNPRSRALEILAGALLAGCLAAAPLAAQAAPIWRVSLAPSEDGLPLRAEAPPLQLSTSSLAQRLGLAGAQDAAHMSGRGDFAEYNFNAARPRIYTRQGLEGFGRSRALLADSMFRRGRLDSSSLVSPPRLYRGPRPSSRHSDPETSRFDTRGSGVDVNLSYRFR